MSDLLKAWSDLKTGADGTAGFVRLRVSEPARTAVYAGRRRSDGREALLIEVPTPALPAGLELPTSEGLEVQALPTVPGPTGRTSLHVVFTDERFRELFFTLSEDILQAVLGGKGDTDSVRRFVSRIHRWQAFLRRHGAGGLSEDELRGLFGELWLLDQLLRAGLRPEVAVTAWRGPLEDAHDFQLPGASVEVKTTRAATPAAISVSNVKQLDDRGLPVLMLLVLQVEESASAGSSLADVVDSIRTALDDPLRDDFDERLFRSGYADQQLTGRRVCRYTLRRQRWFEVKDGFPRLLAPDLPPGVIDVRFSVQLPQCAPYERQSEAVLSTLLGGLT